MSADSQGFVDNLVSAVNGRDIDRLVDCFADGYVNLTPAHPARGFTGRRNGACCWSALSSSQPCSGWRACRRP